MRSLLITLLLGLMYDASMVIAWISPQRNHSWQRLPRSRSFVNGRIDTPSGLEEEGNNLIRNALLNAGCTEEQINIAWKGGRIVVTISGSTFLQDDDDDYVDDSIEDDLWTEDTDDMSSIDEMKFAIEAEEEMEDRMNDIDMIEGVNIVELTRAIQAMLDTSDETSTAGQIRNNYEIEVTTPGAPDELQGIMFESYRGFDVIVDFLDKDDKRKTLEGRLVERNAEMTVIKLKGRMKKIPNDSVSSVRLPKAKKE